MYVRKPVCAHFCCVYAGHLTHVCVRHSSCDCVYAFSPKGKPNREPNGRISGSFCIWKFTNQFPVFYREEHQQIKTWKICDNGYTRQFVASIYKLQSSCQFSVYVFFYVFLVSEFYVISTFTVQLISTSMYDCCSLSHCLIFDQFCFPRLMFL